MTKTNTTIEINGKRYDARTGTALQAPKAVVDDVVRPGSSTPPAQPVSRRKPLQAPQPISSRPLMDVRPAPKTRSGNNHAATHQPQAAKTLKRQAVHKPAASLKAKTKVATRTDILAARPKLQVAPKLSIRAVDAKREKRAAQIAQSKFISRHSELVHHPLAGLHPALQGAAGVSQVSASASAAPASHQPVLDIFEHALKHATSHEQPAVRRRKTKRHGSSRLSARVANIGTAGFALLLIAGFVAYQNAPSLQLHLASSKAGFSANLPGYRPPGFGIGRFSYSPGAVAVNFVSHSDDRHFSVIERASNWDSQALLNDFVATANPDYQAVDAAGRTLYLYGDNDASWVANGIWYQVRSSGSLSTSQLIELASSM